MRVVIATGVASVVTQLLTIREFLSQFKGNEIIIALILFNWLILGGIGTLLARLVTRRLWKPGRLGLVWLSLVLAALSGAQILGIRMLRDLFFIHGSSVGFYATWLYSFLIIIPYCLLLGFVLPYSLFILRNESRDYPAARIYITDNIGDVSGGILFSFALVYLLTPLQAVFLANLPLLATVYFLIAGSRRQRVCAVLGTGAAAVILVAGVWFEKPSLMPAEGQLAYYQETRYGRIAVHRDQDQFTLFEDGKPVYSNQNISVAEETIHYPLAQLDDIEHVLLISAEGGVMQELQKYRLTSIDYVELDPQVATTQFRFGMLEKIPGLQLIHQDGRAFLAGTNKTYDAIIVNLPEPETFQINRFYTDRFFQLARAHLRPGGVLSFGMQGFQNYIAEPQRQKYSSLYNTAAEHFKHVTLLPGQKVFFVCRNQAIDTDIPAALARKGIATSYVSGFYYGNLTPERIDRLKHSLDESVPINRDPSPYLIRVMFSQWFAKYQSSPIGFIIAVIGLSLFYLLRVSREEFVLFSTGCTTMGSEILVIFAFQIFFGYIYLQIGIIITVFLAGLLPGAWLGNRQQLNGKLGLALSDGILMALLGLFILALTIMGDRLPILFYLAFGFSVSLACGYQFPVALNLSGRDNAAATRSFSADLIGAGCGILITSTILIPYLGIIWAGAGLIGMKFISLLVIGTRKASVQ
jgi:spermidine synthase